MSKGININSSFLKSTDNRIQGVISYKKEKNIKVVGVENQNLSDEKATETILNISREARLKSANHAIAKKAGITSAREVWENDAFELKQNARGNRGIAGPDDRENMRLVAPEMYIKMEALFQESVAHGGFSSAEGEKYFLDAIHVNFDFIDMYYYSDEKNNKTLIQQYGVLDTLDAMYSDVDHDTSFNFYREGYSNRESSLWRFKSKFNVLLTVNMLDTLITHDSEKKSEHKRLDLLSRIDNAVTDIKAAERNYEGDLEYLRFGVKLWDDGKVTYHANYKGCENAEGITADSADELLKMLM